MNTKLLFKNFVLVCGLAITSILGAQTPKSVCQIIQTPMDRDHIVSAGAVSSIAGDDFYLDDGGCSIKCDLNDGVPLPSMGDRVVVYGNVEADDDDPLELDVYTWTKEGGQVPQPPLSTVSKAADASAAPDGTVAELSGTITSWTDESDGEGVFTDESGSINMDFEDNNKPALDIDIIVVGVVTTDDGAKEIEVHFWYPGGGTAPEIPTNVAFTITAANTDPIGSIAYLDGILSSWIITGDQGVLTDGSDNIEVDFDGDEARPSIDDEITVLGIIDDDNGTREIEVKAWVLSETTSIYKTANLSVEVYPNPAQDYLMINSAVEFSSVKFISIEGRDILQQRFVKNNLLDVRTLSQGSYILLLLDDSGVVGVKRIIKE